MRNREHKNLYDDRIKVKSSSKVLKKQNDKLESLVTMFKKRNEKLLEVHKTKA